MKMSLWRIKASTQNRAWSQCQLHTTTTNQQQYNNKTTTIITTATIIAVISIAPYFTDMGEHTALYKISINCLL